MHVYSIYSVVSPEDADRHDLADAYGEMPRFAYTDLRRAIDVLVGEANAEIDECNADNDADDAIAALDPGFVFDNAGSHDFSKCAFTFDTDTGTQWIVARIEIDAA